jgi:hypothetical protein
LRTVEETPNGKFESFVHQVSSNVGEQEVIITKDNCKQLVYPRTLRGRQRVKELEEKLEEDMVRFDEKYAQEPRSLLQPLAEKV